MKTHPGPCRGPDWILDNGSDGLVEVKHASLEATRFRQDPFFWRQRRFPDFAELKKRLARISCDKSIEVSVPTNDLIILSSYITIILKVPGGGKKQQQQCCRRHHCHHGRRRRRRRRRCRRRRRRQRCRHPKQLLLMFFFQSGDFLN